MAEEKFEAHVADQEPSLDDWIQYAIAGNAMINNGEVISQRVQDMRPKLFCKPDKMVIDVLDVVKSKFSKPTKIPTQGGRTTC